MSTTKYKNNIIEILGPNITADWKLSDASSALDSLEPGIPIRRIMFTPNASRDKVVIKERNAAGPIICSFECANSYDQKIVQFYGKRHKPFIDISAGSHGRTSGSVLQIEHD